jgi:hypothetical protein
MHLFEQLFHRCKQSQFFESCCIVSSVIISTSSNPVPYKVFLDWGQRKLSCGAMPREYVGYTPLECDVWAEIAAQVGLSVPVCYDQFSLHWTAIFLAIRGGWH